MFPVVLRYKVEIVAKMLKSIHAQESKKAEDGIEETLTYCDFPGEHRMRIRTNDVVERLNREIRRRNHVAGTQWGNKRYMNMEHGGRLWAMFIQSESANLFAYKF